MLAWFAGLEPPVQTALIALPVTLLGAVGGVIALFIKKPTVTKGTPQVEIAGVMMDRDTVKLLANNIDKLVGQMMEGVKWKERQTRSIEALTDELKDVRQELRYLGSQSGRRQT